MQCNGCNSRHQIYNKKLKKRWFNHLKEIKKEEMELLKSRQIINNSDKGFVDRSGNVIGFYRTRNKRYIEDKYVNIAKKIKADKLK